MSDALHWSFGDNQMLTGTIFPMGFSAPQSTLPRGPFSPKQNWENRYDGIYSGPQGFADMGKVVYGSFNKNRIDKKGTQGKSYVYRATSPDVLVVINAQPSICSSMASQLRLKHAARHNSPLALDAGTISMSLAVAHAAESGRGKGEVTQILLTQTSFVNPCEASVWHIN